MSVFGYENKTLSNLYIKAICGEKHVGVTATGLEPTIT